MVELPTNRSARGNSPRPVHDQRRPNASAMGVTLVPFQGSVRGLRPASRIMRERSRAANIFKTRKAYFRRFTLIHHVFSQVERAGRTAFVAGTVVGQEHDQRVVQTIDRL